MSASATRRSFLRGFAALSAVGGGATAVIAAKANPSAEAPLLALGVDLATALTAYEDRIATLAESRRRYEEIKPEIPDEIRAEGLNGWVHTEWPLDFDGRSSPAHVQQRIRIACKHHLEERVKSVDGRTTVGRRIRAAKKASDAYHAAIAAAREKVGAEAASYAAHRAGRDMLAVGFAIAELEATTLAGLEVKARAAMAMARFWEDEHRSRMDPCLARLCRDIIAISGASVGAVATLS